MSARTTTAAVVIGGLGAAGGLVVAAPAAMALPSACDAYSNNCTDVGGTKIEKPPATEVKGTRFELPFTGGEITLMVLAAGGALAGGTVLLVAGRRRNAGATDLPTA